MAFWLEDPSILFKSDKLKELYPEEHFNLNEKLNALSRFILYLTFIGYVFLKKKMIVVIGIILLGIIVIFYKYKRQEGFQSPDIKHTILNHSMNPLGNTLMQEYKENPYKETSILKQYIEPDSSYGKTRQYETTYNKDTEKKINNKVKQFIKENNSDNPDIQKLFSNEGNNRNFNSSMRQFYTVANTTVPNDQNDFLSYCYGTLPSNKSVISY